MKLVDKLQGWVGVQRRKLVCKMYDRYYGDLQDYIAEEEPNWKCGVMGVTLNFPVDRERLYIVVDGKPIVAQEGCHMFVTTKRYQFESAAAFAREGSDVYCIHNHPHPGSANPSQLDLDVCEKFPELDHYIVCLSDKKEISMIKYNKDGIIYARPQGGLHENNA